MKYEKPELVVGTKELPRVTVNFAQPPSDKSGKPCKKTPSRVLETRFSSVVSSVNGKTKSKT